MPFITEEIWLELKSKLKLQEETIMLRPYPSYQTSRLNKNAKNEINWIKQFIIGVRQIRGEMNIPPGKILPVIVQKSNNEDELFIEKYLGLIKYIGRIESIRKLDYKEKEPISSMAMHGKMKLLVLSKMG